MFSVSLIGIKKLQLLSEKGMLKGSLSLSAPLLYQRNIKAQLPTPLETFYSFPLSLSTCILIWGPAVAEIQSKIESLK